MRLIFFLFLIHIFYPVNAQVKIHAHNDYDKPQPLLDALKQRVFSIEADVFLVRGELLIAHSIKETSRKKTLSSLYIEPIVQLFKKNNGAISEDSSYTTILFIDIKQNGTDVLQELIRVFEPLRFYFDRSVNARAFQLIISGDRGPISEWKNYPSYIYFDGRPYEEYDAEAIAKIAMISDNYYKYLSKRNTGDIVKIKEVVQKAISINKPFRFWASPDTEAVWKLLKECGAAIINTDKPAACRTFFTEKYKLQEATIPEQNKQ